MPWLRAASASSSRPMPSPGSAMRAPPRDVGREIVMRAVSRRPAGPRTLGRHVLGDCRTVSADLGRVAALTRYPVKSMTGESLPEASVEPRGLVGDRGWAVYTERSETHV